MREMIKIGVSLAAMALSVAAARAEESAKISIVVFGPPSLGAFLPPIIKAQKLDEKNGLSISFQERTPDAYTAQFNSGEFSIGGSAALLSIGLADIRGVKVTYLFNLFDYWGGVVTSHKDIQTIKDLEGKDIAAAKGTTNYVMFDWFARQLGTDTSKFSVVNTATPGLIGYALADRATAVQLWEPAYSALHAKMPGIRTLDLKIVESWQKATGSRNIPYLGVAAHTSWVTQNGKLIPKLYATYKQAAEWVASTSRRSSQADRKPRRRRGTEGDHRTGARKRSPGDERQMGVRGRERDPQRLRRRSLDRVPSLRAFDRDHLCRSEAMTEVPDYTGPRADERGRRATGGAPYALPFIVVAGLWQLAFAVLPALPLSFSRVGVLEVSRDRRGPGRSSRTCSRPY